MKGWLTKGLLAVAGVAAMLAYWTLRGAPEGHGSTKEMPSKVYEGGGGSVTVHVELSHAGKVRAAFEKVRSDGKHDLLEVWLDDVPAGSHDYTIEVPPETTGMVEAGVEDPAVGATAKVMLTGASGKVLQDEQVLEKPLQPGYAFFAQVELDDWAKALAEGESEGGSEGPQVADEAEPAD